MKDFIIEQFKLLSLPQIIAYGIGLVTLTLILVMHIIERKDINTGLRGKNGIWEFVELAGRVWLMLFVPLVVIAVMGVAVPHEVWWSMDSIFGIITLGKSYVRGKEIEHRRKDEEPPLVL